MKLVYDTELEKQKLARAEEIEKKYEEEVAALAKKISYEDTLGPAVVMDLFKKEIAKAEGLQTNALTTSLYLDDWVHNFAANIPLIPADHPFFGDVIRIKDSAIIVGAGPSLTDEQIDSLKDYKGTIICCNKSLKRLFERNVYPHIAVVIHSTDEVLEHFDDPIVKYNLNRVKVVCSSCISPNVARVINQFAGDVLWFHAEIPDNIVPNLNTLLCKMRSLGVVDTGGNVGLMSVQVAQYCGAKTIAILGMEHCEKLNPEWTNAEALQYNIIYAPEDKLTFALTPVMRAYLQVLHSWYMNNRNQFRIYNLTPNGLFYVRRRDWMPFMEVAEFVRQFD